MLVRLNRITDGLASRSSTPFQAATTNAPQPLPPNTPRPEAPPPPPKPTR